MDTTNRAIIAQLTDIAKGVFAACKPVNAEPVNASDIVKVIDAFRKCAEQERHVKLSFTSQAIKEGKKKLSLMRAKLRKIDTAKVRAHLFELTEPKTVAAGSFSMSFPAYMAFVYLAKFEQIERIPAAQRATFRAEGEPDGVEFEVVIPREAAALSGIATVEAVFPARAEVHVNVTASEIVGTDGRAIAVYPVEISGDVSDLEGAPVLLPAKHIKALAGQRITVYYDNNTRTTTAITEDGKRYTCVANCAQWVDYRRVLPSLHSRGFIQVAPAGVKIVASAVKRAARGAGGDDVITLAAKEGAAALRISLGDDNGEISVPLSAPAQVTARVSLRLRSFLRVVSVWAGGLWLGASSCALDCPGAVATVLCYANPPAESHTIPAGVFPALERFNYLPEGVTLPAQKKAATRKKTASTAAPVAKVEEPQITPAEIGNASTDYATNYTAWIEAEFDGEAPAGLEALLDDLRARLLHLVEAYNLQRGVTPQGAKDDARAYVARLQEDTARAEIARRNRITQQRQRVIDFVAWLGEAVDVVAAALYHSALLEAVERVKSLAALAGVELVDVLADAVPVEITAPAAPPTESPAPVEAPEVCTEGEPEGVTVDASPFGAPGDVPGDFLGALQAGGGAPSPVGCSEGAPVGGGRRGRCAVSQGAPRAGPLYGAFSAPSIRTYL